MELLDSIKRRRLSQKGLSSGKKRRTQADGPVASRLDRSTVLRYSVYGAFALLTAALAFHFATDSGSRPFSTALSSLLLVGMAVFLFEACHPKTARRNGHLFLIFCCLAVQLACVRLVTVMVDANSSLGEPFKLLLIPYAFAPMILSVLLRTNLGLYAVAGTTLLGAFLMPTEFVLPYLVMSVVCGLAAVLVTRQVRKRGRLLRAGFYVGGAAVLLACSFNIISLGSLIGGGMVE
ncbi:MAG: hypothetical protein QGG01_07020, partial [Roseibacillus sp.]|nr:hypothetical protein [Roseibacillus sp.]